MARNLSLFPEGFADDSTSLFQDSNNSEEKAANKTGQIKPLAERLRPNSWELFQGLSELDQNLISQVRSGGGRPVSMVIWGPAGCGKTTLAKLIGSAYEAEFVELSAVLSGVKEVREVVERAKRSRKRTILFVDEIHRFNKAQQDAFLPHVEAGTISLIGATTENPSFHLTSALLSRLKLVVLPPLSAVSLRAVLKKALEMHSLVLSDGAQKLFVDYAQGDARRLLNLFEGFAFYLSKEGVRDIQNSEVSTNVEGQDVSDERVKKFLTGNKVKIYDRSGDEHYSTVSAFIKSMRGSEPNAALYWAFKMIEAGEDPRFVIRRMIIFASEDVGNSDPMALSLAIATAEAYDRLGLPEGKIPIAQCITYLASTTKSNRSYLGMHAAISALSEYPNLPVPHHLRNAPTEMMKGLGFGAGYQYPHDQREAFIHDCEYLPSEVASRVFYEPSDRGKEREFQALADQRKGSVRPSEK